MSELKFTPGPWFRKGKMVLHCAPEKELPLDLPNGVVARCLGGPKDWDGLDDEANANASLISAAPEMYDMLVKFRNFLRYGNGGHLSQSLDKLLAKARGEQQ